MTLVEKLLPESFLTLARRKLGLVSKLARHPSLESESAQTSLGKIVEEGLRLEASISWYSKMLRMDSAWTWVDNSWLSRNCRKESLEYLFNQGSIDHLNLSICTYLLW